MDSIRAREADGLHNVLYGMAPAVASSVDATHMTLAGGLELVTACRTDDMPHIALEDGGLQREEAHAAVEGVGFLHRHVPGRRSSLRRHP